MSETQPYYQQMFLDHTDIRQLNGLIYQLSAYRKNDFESHYSKIRQFEGRLYSNAVLKNLPEFKGDVRLVREWKIRRRSMKKLIAYLRKRSSKMVVEVGCGNGWLIHAIQRDLNIQCCGVDINEIELLQASEIFGRNNKLVFVYGDVLSNLFKNQTADAIIIASAIQYFPDPKELLTKLLPLLIPGGQIHIIDSPFYNSDAVLDARQRSRKYFTDSGSAEMNEHYFHHDWKTISSFRYRLAHDPGTLINKLARPLNSNSPFPWIVIDG